MAISRRIRIYIATAAAFGVALSATGIIVAKQTEKNAREHVITMLKEQFAGDVALGSLDLSLFPRVRAVGNDLVVRIGGRSELPPMILARRFTVTASLISVLRHPRHIASVEISGLQIHLPPEQERPERHAGVGTSTAAFVVEEVIADGTTLEILPKDARKTPLEFDLKRLRLAYAGTKGAMNFHTEMMNALPPGIIQSDGQIGPWLSDEPGDTPVSGQYNFRNAELSVFKGIKGTLASEGKYQGTLARIEVQGTTDVPDFALALAGHPMHLRTIFAATVDGTNGDTDLHPVRAILATSEFEVSGSVERGALAQGKEINLNTKSVKGSLADFLRLAVKGAEPPMTGTLTFESKIKIPHGPAPIIDKLQLDGRFMAAGVKFTSPEVQEKIANLSHRAEGDPKDHDPDVTASIAGQFILDNGTMSLPQLAFDLPGAKVNLDGTYALGNGLINFKGTARLDATVSHMTTGIKSVLLKPIDPLFEHDGAGAVVPIAISGTRGAPSFRLDIGRAMSRSAERHATAQHPNQVAQHSN